MVDGEREPRNPKWLSSPLKWLHILVCPGWSQFTPVDPVKQCIAHLFALTVPFLEPGGYTFCLSLYPSSRLLLAWGWGHCALRLICCAKQLSLLWLREEAEPLRKTVSISTGSASWLFRESHMLGQRCFEMGGWNSTHSERTTLPFILFFASPIFLNRDYLGTFGVMLLV